MMYNYITRARTRQWFEFYAPGQDRVVTPLNETAPLYTVPAELSFSLTSWRTVTQSSYSNHIVIHHIEIISLYMVMGLSSLYMVM